MIAFDTWTTLPIKVTFQGGILCSCNTNVEAEPEHVILVSVSKNEKSHFSVYEEVGFVNFSNPLLTRTAEQLINL